MNIQKRTKTLTVLTIVEPTGRVKRFCSCHELKAFKSGENPAAGLIFSLPKGASLARKLSL